MDGSLDGEPINLNGTCQDAQNETIDFAMNPEETFTEITTICLEEGQDYKLKFTFDRYDPAVPDPSKNIFIDSVSFHFLDAAILQKWTLTLKNPGFWEVFFRRNKVFLF